MKLALASAVVFLSLAVPAVALGAGPTGAAGPTGVPGCSAADDCFGPAGPTGPGDIAPGCSGPSSCTGIVGPSGATGPTGCDDVVVHGPTGFRGTTGAGGPTGSGGPTPPDTPTNPTDPDPPDTPTDPNGPTGAAGRPIVIVCVAGPAQVGPSDQGGFTVTGVANGETAVPLAAMVPTSAPTRYWAVLLTAITALAIFALLLLPEIRTAIARRKR